MFLTDKLSLEKCPHSMTVKKMIDIQKESPTWRAEATPVKNISGCSSIVLMLVVPFEQEEKREKRE